MLVSFNVSEALFVLVGFVLGAIIVGAAVFGLLKNSCRRRLEARNTELAVTLERLHAQCSISDRLQLRQDQLATELRGLNEYVAELRSSNAALETLLDEARRQGEEKIMLLNQAGERMKAEFQNLAQIIFEEKSRVFADQNRLSMDGLVRPLREQMSEFKQRIEDVYDKETRDRTALQVEIGQLKELNQRLAQEALNLTRALKGDSKMRGNWGELVLEKVLEVSGLEKGREYQLQVTLHDSGGHRFQPDALIYLPQGRHVIVDAKVSLNAYEAFFNAGAQGERERYLAAHQDALRRHIRELSAKSYQNLEGVRSLDFTLMFIPVEAALSAVLNRNGDLWREAYEKNIMLVTPSTLLVTLRVIENIWRSEHQSRNAAAIARKAGALYDKFVGFVQVLEEVGRHLDLSVAAYHSAHNRLATGRGNLVRRALELKALGAQATKQLPAGVEERAEEE